MGLFEAMPASIRFGLALVAAPVSGVAQHDGHPARHHHPVAVVLRMGVVQPVGPELAPAGPDTPTLGLAGMGDSDAPTRPSHQPCSGTAGCDRR